MVLHDFKIGMTVYDRYGLFPISIKKINTKQKQILAVHHWKNDGYDRLEWYNKSEWSKWKLNKKMQ